MSVQIDDPAFVHPSAKIGNHVSIGHFCHIGPNVTLHDNVKIMPNVYMDGYTDIGEGCTIFPFASIGTACQDLKYRGERTFVKIGANTIIRESVTVNSSTGQDESTVVGENCLIMAYSHIAHNCLIGNNVIIANAGTLAGHVTIEDHVIIGGLTAIHQFTRIGVYAIVGGCSKVVRDIPPFMMADGHPARVYGLNSIGLRRHKFSAQSRKEIKQAYKILFRGGLTRKHALEKIRQDLPADSREISTLIDFIQKSSRGICR